MSIFGRSIPFYKMQGCGNDFVVIDNREAEIPREDMSLWARKLCARAFGIHADGVFFLEETPKDSGLDFRWHFYNSDGSRAEMCGNASRCAARLAHAIGLAPAQHVFGTDAGPIHARVILDGPDAGQAKVQLTPPKDIDTNISLNVDGKPLTVHFADTGVPHAVIFVDDVQAVDIMDLGPKIRYHDHFSPAGTNVNFAQAVDEKTSAAAHLRTRRGSGNIRVRHGRGGHPVSGQPPRSDTRNGPAHHDRRRSAHRISGTRQRFSARRRRTDVQRRTLPRTPGPGPLIK